MARSEDLKVLAGQRFIIGPSTIQGFTAVAGQLGVALKFASGCSNFSIGTTTYTDGYKMTDGEVLSLNMTGTFYGTAIGGTAVCYLLSARGE